MIAVGSPFATSLANVGPLIAPIRGTKPVARAAQQFGDDFGHAQQGIVLDTFGGADEQHLRPKMWQHRLKHAASVMRRHDAYDNLRAMQRLLEAVGGANRFRYRVARQRIGRSRDGRGRSRTPRAREPTTAPVRLLAAQHNGDCRAPRARANDCDFAHQQALFHRQRFSVPAIRRRMLSLCRTMISNDDAAISSKIGKVVRSAGLSHHTSNGKAAAATMLPNEM